ncbi:hypothetical protein NL676_028584 [Syzygium grande]|nr:hypothetical protein NL676_028584 [Syzygium grande]
MVFLFPRPDSCSQPSPIDPQPHFPGQPGVLRLVLVQIALDQPGHVTSALTIPATGSALIFPLFSLSVTFWAVVVG